MWKNIIRSFHSSNYVRGWQQDVVVGYGLPITNTMYNKCKTFNKKHYSERITTLKHYNQETIFNYSDAPLIFNTSYLLTNGSVLFTTPIQVKTSTCLVDNNILGPLTNNNQIEEIVGGVGFIYYSTINNKNNINYEYNTLVKQLKELDIDVNSLAKLYYAQIIDEPKFSGHVEKPFDLWLYQNRIKIKDGALLKDFMGYYILGLGVSGELF